MPPPPGGNSPAGLRIEEDVAASASRDSAARRTTQRTEEIMSTSTTYAIRRLTPILAALALWGLALFAWTSLASADTFKTNGFQGVKANTGFATIEKTGGKTTLTWSDDFTIPDAPAPHWQLVDTKGNVYLLERLVAKNDKKNRTITVPGYVKDVAKVQIWCAWAEVLLGEATLDKPVKL
jgi:hypothetical protein